MSDVKQQILDVFKTPLVSGLATIADGKPWVRYVMAFMDENLTIRVATGIDSRKVAQIKANPDVHVTAGFTTLEATKSYLQIQGRAEISLDKEERHGMWYDHLKAYFSGPDDPKYAVIVIKPIKIEVAAFAGGKESAVWEA
jgi:general stress protein 26